MEARLVIAGMALVAIVGTTAFFADHAWKNKHPETVPTAEISFDKLQALYQERMQLEVQAHLKDPDSAHFQSLHYYPSVFLGKHGEKVTIAATLCGEVNAKNSYGGYTGYHSFYISEIARHPSPESTLFGVDDDPERHDSFQNSYARECIPKEPEHEK